MKVFSLAPKENWIIDRIVKEWKEAKPELHTGDFNEADLLWIISPWLWQTIPVKILKNKKVVLSIHHITVEKFTKQMLKEFLIRDQFVDQYHVPCQKTKDFVAQITKKPIEIIGYWYNSKTWHPVDKAQSRKRIEIPLDKYVIGSFQRDTEGHDLISPKLEKGPDLFIETVKKINKEKENLLVLLGGWRRQYVIKRLEEEGIEYHFIEMAPLDALRDMYASCDLYIVASRTEGGPQSILEASAMKVPIVSRDVGMASMVLNDRCVVNMPKNIYIPVKEDVEICYDNVKRYEVSTAANNYVNLFKSVLGE